MGCGDAAGLDGLAHLFAVLVDDAAKHRDCFSVFQLNFYLVADEKLLDSQEEVGLGASCV